MRAVLLSFTLTFLVINANALDSASSKQMKTFRCTGGDSGFSALGFSAPSAEIAVGLYQAGAVLMAKTKNSTFTGGAYNLATEEVVCTEIAPVKEN